MGWTRLGITSRLILALSVCGAVVFVTVFYLNRHFTSSMVEGQVQAHARDVVNGAVYNIDDQLMAVSRNVKGLVSKLEGIPTLDAKGLRRLLHDHFINNEEIFGAAIAVAPELIPAGEPLLAPYSYRGEGDTLIDTDLTSPGYNFPMQPWYLLPATSLKPVWSEPYFDQGGGNQVMVTCSMPFYRVVNGVRRFAGIATSDISVDWLGRQIAALKLHRNGYAALFSQKGVYLAHPDRSLLIHETIFSVADRMQNQLLKDIGRGVSGGKTGFVIGKNVRNQESWIYYRPVPSTGWSLAVVFPASEMRREITRIGQLIALSSLTGVAVLIFAIILVARGVNRPLDQITAAVLQIADGNLDTELPKVQIGGAVRQLADSFERMQHDLKRHIRELTEATAAKERMEGELSVAHDLQMAILPHTLPQLDRFQICGKCLPAREVGGDFYDACLLPDGRLFFIIGDISGKGVPAALYMTMTVTIARGGISDGYSPVQLLRRINRELCRDNESCMFATVLCGTVDLQSGELSLANAGHTQPLIRLADGTVKVINLKSGVIAGVIEDAVYEEERLMMEPGDMLLLYTDGVTEAVDSGNRLFGMERLQEVMGEGDDGPEMLIRQVEQAVGSFAAGTPQADDLTMLAIFRLRFG